MRVSGIKGCQKIDHGGQVHTQDDGVPLNGPAMMLRDNMSIVLNTHVPSSVLKKKHNASCYHWVEEKQLQQRC